MAKYLSEREIKQIELLDYHTVRNSIQSGDLVFCSGRSRFSTLIKWFTQSTFSHCAIVYRLHDIDSVLIFESGRHGGVHLTPLSYYVKKYDGKVLWAKVDCEIDENKRNEIFKYGFELLTKPYDKGELFRIFKRVLFNIGRRVNNKEYVCSELVQSCYSKAGVHFKSVNNIVLPDHIWKDDRVICNGRLM